VRGGVYKGKTVPKNPLVRPFLKWAGGKRQLLPELIKLVPAQYGTYYEPFLGGGALFLDLQRKRAVVNDSNTELINCYEAVRDHVEDLIAALEEHRAHHSEDYYYEVRDWDRAPDFANRPSVERAARIVFLNKTCYNGLFRVNSQGQFNVPYGRYKDPTIVDAGVLRAVSKYLTTADIAFRHVDFAEAVADAQPGDLIYFDPPYDPASSTASFTGYDLNGFSRAEQARLKRCIDELTVRRCKVLLSNAATPFIMDLYRGYCATVVGATRAINSKPDRRGKVDEILVTNYAKRNNAHKKRQSVGTTLRAASDTRTSETLWALHH
jgi:DNA adenine methylase